MNTKIRKLTYIALLTSLATLLVAPFLRVPSPYGGVMHVADSIIFVTAVFFGPVPAAIVGGIGHSLANILFGPQIFAPWTLVIKGIMGFVVGLIAYKQPVKSFRLWIGLICALIILLVGYFTAASVIFMTGGSASAPAPLIFAASNATQWGASVAVTLILLPIMKKILK